MLSTEQLDSFINDLLHLSHRSNKRLSVVTIYSLISDVNEILKKDPVVLNLKGPLNICGDVHGQFKDLLRVFQCGGMPSDSKYLFLGDYVDRGKQSLEVICLLYAFKLKYPNQIFLLRGNHESPEMSEVFGFYTECCAKATANAWKKFCDSFRYLPLAAVIDNQHFCIHGGISPDLKSIDQIKKFKRPLDIPEEGLLADLLWSDPDCTITRWGPNNRGTTVCYGPKAAEKFLKANNLKTIIRGHQLAQNGYEFPFGSNKSVVTIFTASKYAGQCDNKAAFMKIDIFGNFNFITLPSHNYLLSSSSKMHPGTPRKMKSFYRYF